MGSEWILGRWLRGGVEWIQLALVNKVMNLQLLAPRS
jgi:hypothetical protein